MNAKHTPGPWNVAEIQREDWRSSICADDCEIGCAYHRNDDPVNADEETYANARLIAAAPELLAVCKQTWHYIHSRQRPGDDGERDNPSYTINIIEKCLSEAISKAEGRA